MVSCDNTLQSNRIRIYVCFLKSAGMIRVLGFDCCGF